jgi:hypothetical protein
VTQRSYITTLQLSTIAVTTVSAVCALAALIAGSALQFGVATALGAGWLIAADFIESSVGSPRAIRRRAVPAAQFNRALAPCRVVVVGGEHTARPVSRRTAIPYH